MNKTQNWQSFQNFGSPDMKEVAEYFYKKSPVNGAKEARYWKETGKITFTNHVTVDPIVCRIYTKNKEGVKACLVMQWFKIPYLLDRTAVLN